MTPDATRRQVEDFVTREARLADENRYEEWLELWDDEASYWVPANEDDIDPQRHVSVIYDDRERLEDRVTRLTKPSAHSQDPPSRMRRTVANFEYPSDGTDEHPEVAANFCIVGTRRGKQFVYAGRVEYGLRRTPEGLRLRSKKVLLVDNDVPLENVSFLL